MAACIVPRLEYELASYPSWHGYEANTCIHMPLVCTSYLWCFSGTISDSALRIPTWASHIHAWQPENDLNESIGTVWFGGKILANNCQNLSSRWEWGVESGNSVDGVEEVTMVSPCSVFLCRISSNLSGVPSPWLAITPFKNHSIVRVPPDDEDCTDSVEGGGKRWGTWVIHVT